VFNAVSEKKRAGKQNYRILKLQDKYTRMLNGIQLGVNEEAQTKHR